MDNPAFLGKEEFQIIYIGFHFESTTVVVFKNLRMTKLERLEILEMLKRLERLERLEKVFQMNKIISKE